MSEKQLTTALINIYVDLPWEFKGAHMNRFVEVQTLAFNSRDFIEGLSTLKEKHKAIFRGE
jgi:GTP cyclohydrolase FolE2